MEAQYSPYAITAAKSLQTYTVCLIVIDPMDNHSSAASICTVRAI